MAVVPQPVPTRRRRYNGASGNLKRFSPRFEYNSVGLGLAPPLRGCPRSFVHSIGQKPRRLSGV